jgi:NADPH:quinone reductase-like Zn-dependent oxidoreductase
MAEMKAVLCVRAGPPDVLRLRSVEKPVPGEGEVLIAVYATTVTAGDVVLRRLRGPLRWIFRLAFGFGRSAVLGHELAGVVEAVGDGVTRLWQGDSVFASTGNQGGAYAEYISLPENGMLAAKPTNVSFEQAAAVPIGANTALHLLRLAGIQPGQSVLIYGASGSVGTYAVQLARHFGAEVVGVCSAANLDMVQTLGAARAIDYTREDFSRSRESYDVVFDAVGKLQAVRARRALKPKGVFLSVKSPTSEQPENLLFLKRLVEAGQMRVVIDRRYPMEQIPEAHRYVELGHKRGNVVITIRPDQASS